MKKLFILLLLLLCGCGNSLNSPTSRVEEYLSSYQMLDKSALKKLNSNIDKSYFKKYKKDLVNIFEKGYQNLSYKIVKEEKVGNYAFVNVELEVLDYKGSIDNSRRYFIEHKWEFVDRDKLINDLDKEESFIKYSIEKLGKVRDKNKYEILFKLEKVDNTWKIYDLSHNDIKKIHGLY